MNCDEELAGFVVDGVSDALDLLLQRFVHPSQRGNGFLKTAMRHFIRREDLREKLIAERGQAIHAGAIRFLAQRKKESFLVNQDKFDEAGATGHSFPAQFVGLTEDGFVLAGQVRVQRGRIVFREGGAFSSGGGGRLHSGPPRKRAMKMRASSFPLQCLARILSAER